MFRLQFPLEQVPAYAVRYTDDDDDVLAIGRAVRDRGHYTLDEFRSACRWKTPRSAPLVAENSPDSVETSTRLALGETGSDRERVKALQSLRGVGVPTASVLLHLVYPERYPILDVRALHALGVPAPSYGYRFWESYVTEYRRLIKQAGVDGRTLDQALWQWSREQGTPSTESRSSYGLVLLGAPLYRVADGGAAAIYSRVRAQSAYLPAQPIGAGQAAWIV